MIRQRAIGPPGPRECARHQVEAGQRRSPVLLSLDEAESQRLYQPGDEHRRTRALDVVAPDALGAGGHDQPPAIRTLVLGRYDRVAERLQVAQKAVIARVRRGK